MTIGQQSQQKAVHQIFLTHHNVSDLLAERRNPLTQLSHFLRNFLRRFHTVFVRHVLPGERSIKPDATASLATLSQRNAICALFPAYFAPVGAGLG